MNEENVRRDPRIARPFTTRYRASKDPNSPWQISLLKNLSLGGAKFLCEKPFEEGTELEMFITIPMAAEPVAVSAAVAWARPLSGTLVELGVTFYSLDAATQEMLGTAVKYFLKQQKAE